jgi:hypothetical protein
MPGLIDTTTGLMYGDGGINWLDGGLGEPGLDNPQPLPESTMITEDGNAMITETGDTMVTE